MFTFCVEVDSLDFSLVFLCTRQYSFRLWGSVPQTSKNTPLMIQTCQSFSAEASLLLC